MWPTVKGYLQHPAFLCVATGLTIGLAVYAFRGRLFGPSSASQPQQPQAVDFSPGGGPVLPQAPFPSSEQTRVEVRGKLESSSTPKGRSWSVRSQGRSWSLRLPQGDRPMILIAHTLKDQPVVVRGILVIDAELKNVLTERIEPVYLPGEGPEPADKGKGP